MAHSASPTAPQASRVPTPPSVQDDSSGIAALFEPMIAAAAQPAEGPSLTGRTTSLTEPVPPTVQPNFRAEIKEVYDSFKGKTVLTNGEVRDALHNFSKICFLLLKEADFHQNPEKHVHYAACCIGMLSVPITISQAGATSKESDDALKSLNKALELLETSPQPAAQKMGLLQEMAGMYKYVKWAPEDAKVQGKRKCEEAIHSIQLKLANQHISNSEYDLAQKQIFALLNLPLDAASLTPVQKIDLIVVISQHVTMTNQTLQWRENSQSFVDGLQASIQNLNSSDPNKLILLKKFACALELLIPVLDPKSDKDRRGLETLRDQCLKEADQLSSKPPAAPPEAPKGEESSKAPQPPVTPPKVEEPPKAPQPYPSSSFWKYTAYTAVALGAIALAALALRKWRPDILQRIYKH